MCGLINFLRISVQHQLFEYNNDNEKQYINEVIQYIYYDCLFNVPQQNDYGAKCKATKTRRYCYGLLHLFTEKYPFTLTMLQSLILRDPIWYHISKDDLRTASLHYHPSDLE